MVYGRVSLNIVVERGVHQIAMQSADDPSASRSAQAQRVPDHDYRVSHLRVVAIGKFQERGRMAGVYFQNCKIDRPGGSQQLRIPLAVVSQGYSDAERTGNDVFIRNNRSGRIDQEASSDFPLTLLGSILRRQRLNRDVDDCGKHLLDHLAPIHWGSRGVHRRSWRGHSQGEPERGKHNKPLQLVCSAHRLVFSSPPVPQRGKTGLILTAYYHRVPTLFPCPLQDGGAGSGESVALDSANGSGETDHAIFATSAVPVCQPKVPPHPNLREYWRAT